jgi:uncharacterized membrane protein
MKWGSMIEKLRITLPRFISNFNMPLIWFTYFPFIGWMYPFISKKKDRFAMHHGRQAFILAIIFTAVPIILTFSSVFIPRSYRLAQLVLVALVYLSHLVYFSLCAWGFIKVKDNKMYDFPVIKQYAKKLDV